MEFFRDPQKRRRWLFYYAPLVVWIAVILGLGSGMGSMNETSRVIRPLLEFLFPGAAPETLTVYHGFIRKLAHFVEYAVLGLLAFRTFARSERSVLISLGIVLAVAISDEANQSLIATRTSSPWDVALDCLGGFTAVLIASLTRRKVGSEA